MATPFLGEIRLLAGGTVPKGWALCNGQMLPINQNTALFSILGTSYGGDGVRTFQLPDLQGRIPIHAGQGSDLSPYILGQRGGSESIVLTTAQIPAHTHTLQPGVNTGEGGNSDPTGSYLANSGSNQYASQPTAEQFGAAVTTGTTGVGQGHPNLQPALCVSFIIALQGVYPPKN